jgi:hypothetical protein
MVRAIARAAGLAGFGLVLWGCPGFGDRTQGELVGETPTWEADVRPIFEEQCWACHGERPIGGAPYALATYDEVVAHAGEVEAQVVDLNRMPPGLGLPSAERAVVAAWLQGGTPRGEPCGSGGEPHPDSGCGTQPREGLDAAPPDPDAGVTPDLGPAPDMGPEADMGPPPTWAGEIGPLLTTSCATEFCHDSDLPQAALDLTTYAGFTAGSVSGDLRGDGDPSRSMLILRLRGIGGSRMPLTGDPFTEAQIRLCERWIRAGAPEGP